MVDAAAGSFAGVTARPSEPAFVGREGEIAALREALSRGRLVTLTGPGGIGKTRLARRFCETSAHEIPGGAGFCDLSHAASVEELCLGLLRAMGLDAPASQGEALVDRAGAALAARGSCVVVLDNLERLVLPARAVIAAWLAGAKGASFIATSRERLGLEGERVIDLPPLGLPPESDEAVTMFCERARAAGGQIEERDRPAVERLVRELSGIPLAIELCAARAGLLTPAELCEMRPKRLSVLSEPGALGRQRTMRGTIAWSVDMLSPEERAAFAQCSVFRGGFFRDAAEAVIRAPSEAGAPAGPAHVLDLLAALRHKSLLFTERIGDRTRFGMFDVIREHAEEIAADSAKAARERHAAHYLRVLEETAPRTAGQKGGPARSALAIEEENILAMIERHLSDTPGSKPDRASALRALAALEPVLLTQGATARHLDLLMRAAGEGARDPERATLPAELLSRVLSARAIVRRIRGEPQRALEDLEGAIAIASEAGEKQREGKARGALGFLFTQLGRFDDALAQYELAIAALEAGGAPREVLADHHTQMGTMRLDRGEPASARASFSRAKELLGDDGPQRAVAVVLGCIGTAMAQEGQFVEARARQRRAAALLEELGDTRNLALTTMGIARTLLDEGHAAEAEPLLRRAIAMLRTIDYRLGELTVTGHLAMVLHDLGRDEEALSAYRAANNGLFTLGARSREGLFLSGMGALLAKMGHFMEAEDAFHEAEDRLRDVPNPHLREAIRLHRVLLSPAKERPEAIRRAIESVEEARRISPEIRFAIRRLGETGAFPDKPSPPQEGLHNVEDSVCSTTDSAPQGGAPPSRSRLRPPSGGLEITLDPALGKAVIDGVRAVDLRKKPLLSKMLEVLLAAGGRPIDKASLFREVWRADYAPQTRAASLYKAVDRLAHLLSPEDPKRFLRWDEQGSLYIATSRPRKPE